ncbi:MAG: hypothetical protein KatS3mg031_2014 [Chitinophagales bacterium]|nr:MAG: hypothetical protein KatS3mg031_2014 [Chitinophagales bacterium]
MPCNQSQWKGTVVWCALLAALLFTFVFHRLFTDYAFPGRYDSWWHVAAFQELGNYLRSVFTGEPSGYSMHPERGLMKFAEPSPLSGMVYLCIRLFCNDPVYAFAVFTVVLCTLNALGFYFLASAYIHSAWICVAGGLLFAAANYIFGHIDHQNAYFAGNALLALYFLKRFLIGKQWKFLYFFTLSNILQIYFSSTVFVYMNVAVLAMLAANLKVFFSDRKVFGGILLSGLIILAGTLPFTWYFVLSGRLADCYNNALGSPASYLANIHPIDWLRVVPGNLIYPSLNDLQFPVQYLIRSAFPGISLVALLLYVLVKRVKIPLEIPLIILTGFIVSAGSGYYLSDGKVFPMPMKLFYDWVGDGTFLRTPARGYLIAVIGLTLMAVHGLQAISKKPFGGLLVIAFVVVYLTENIPFRMPVYPANPYASWEQSFIHYSDKPVHQTVVLHLPSVILKGLPDFSRYPDEISREYMYSYWSSVKRYACINGSAGITPWSRMRNDSLISDLTLPGKMEHLISENNLDFIIWHRDFVRGRETDITVFLNSRSDLQLLFRENEIYCYHVKKPNP